MSKTDAGYYTGAFSILASLSKTFFLFYFLLKNYITIN